VQRGFGSKSPIVAQSGLNRPNYNRQFARDDVHASHTMTLVLSDVEIVLTIDGDAFWLRPTGSRYRFNYACLTIDPSDFGAWILGPWLGYEQVAF